MGAIEPTWKLVGAGRKWDEWLERQTRGLAGDEAAEEGELEVERPQLEGLPEAVAVSSSMQG